MCQLEVRCQSVLHFLGRGSDIAYLLRYISDELLEDLENHTAGNGEKGSIGIFCDTF